MSKICSEVRTTTGTGAEFKQAADETQGGDPMTTATAPVQETRRDRIVRICNYTVLALAALYPLIYPFVQKHLAKRAMAGSPKG